MNKILSTFIFSLTSADIMLDPETHWILPLFDSDSISILFPVQFSIIKYRWIPCQIFSAVLDRGTIIASSAAEIR